MIRVVAGVLVRDGRALVCQRPAGKDHAGKWEFPGGKIEAGESPAEALRRELREELGVAAAIGRALWKTQHRYPDRAPVEIEFLEVERMDGEIDGRQFAAIRWIEVERLAEADLLEGDLEFVRRLAAVGIQGLRAKDSSDTAGR